MSQSLRGEAARGAAWTLVGSTGQQLLSLAVFTILANLLRPGDFGLVAVAMTYVAFLQRFVDQGLTDAIIQRDRLEDDHLQTAFWMSNAFGLLLAAATYLLAGPIAVLLREVDLAPVIRWLSLMFPLNGLSGVPKAILRKELHFRSLAMRTLASVFVGGVVGVLMALRGHGVWALVGQLLASQAAGVITLWSSVAWRPRLRFSPSHLRELFTFGVHVMGSNLMLFFIARFDRFVIFFFLGSTSLGYFVLASRVPQLIQELSTGTLQQVIYPTIVRIQNDRDRVRRAYYAAIRMVAMTVMPCFLLYIAAAPQIILVAFGEQWLPAVTVTRLMALALMFGGMLQYNTTVLMALGKSSWRFFLLFVSAASGVVLSLVAVQFGLVWVAAAVVLRAYALSPLQFTMIRRLIEIDLATYWSCVRVPLASAAASAGSAFAVMALSKAHLPDYVVLLFGLLCGTVVYLAMIYWLGRAIVWEAWGAIRAARQGRTAATGDG